MIQFMNKQADVLLCTTIIESGLDIPTVNTLIVNNADRFGLAQLYQIRGRVGRSTRQAFAYFIIPPVSSITGDARSRLATLEKFTSVGSGFQVANIDMELRGAGNILGGEQSGHVAAVGFDMFVHLLQEEVEQLKEQQGQPTRNDCHVEFPDLARLPEDYIPDRHQRLVIYRRIAGAEGIAQFEQLRHELLDRFGTIPETAAALLMIAELKVRARDLGITRLIGAATAIKANLEQAPDEVLQAALQLVRKQPFPISVKVPATLIIKLSENDTDVLKSARRLLSLLEEGAGSAASNRSADK
jgi:transcription-repair coupling factor (superfamily II helicase)